MINPLRGYCLVEQLEDDLKTASGIALPESIKDKPIKGIVLTVGHLSLEQEKLVKQAELVIPDITTVEKIFKIRAGDKVIYKRWSTTDFEEGGKKLSFVAFSDILGVYE